MNELTNEVNEEIVMRELTINELGSVNGGCGCEPGRIKTVGGHKLRCASDGKSWVDIT